MSRIADEICMRFALSRFCLPSYLQHSVFAQHSDKLRFVSPGTSFILMHEDG